MNKRAVQAIGITVVTGVLFLQAVVAGGVASEEMGMVMDAMRGLRRSDNIYYELTSFTKGEETVQKIWADLLTEQWVEELFVHDDDGVVVSWKRYFDGEQEWLSDGQSGWETTDSDGSVPGLSTITDFPLGVDDITETKREEKDGCQVLTFTVADELLEKRRQSFIDELETEDAGGSMQEASYQQYVNTRYEHVVISYEIDPQGVLTEIHFSIELTQPQLLLKGGGKYELGEEETYQMGYTVEVVCVNDNASVEKIGECAIEIGENY